MPPDPNFNRLLTAIRHEEPDRVPLIELYIDPHIKASFLDIQSERIFDTRNDDYSVEKDVEFWYKAGYDYVQLSPRYEFPKTWLNHPEARLTSLDDYDQFPWALCYDVDYSRIEKAAEFLPDGMKLIAGPQSGIFEEAWMTMGYNNFMLGLFGNSALIRKVCDSFGDALLKIFEQLAQYKHVGGFWLMDNIACSESLLLSPEMIREYFMPWYEKYAAIARKYNKIFLFHSDGYIAPLLNDLIAIHFDAIHPIPPRAMDVIELKKRYRGKLALLGSVNLNYIRNHGNLKRLKEYIVKRIKEVAPGGGFAIGSSDSTIQYLQYDKFLMMLDTVREFGTYPIKSF